MRKILILVLFCNSLQGQISGYVEYSYSVIHSIDYKTKSVLKFNADKSVFTTFRDDSKNDSVSKLISSEGNTQNYLVNKDSSKKPVFFTDKENNMLITKVWKFREYHILTETLPVISWEIKPEYKTLSDLRCQKAVGYFRGRTYTVWFTEAIPISFGPWKLQGLPGLILEAKDDKNMYFYRATKIKLNTSDTIDLPDLSIAIPLKTFLTEIEPKKWKDLNNQIQAKSDRSITIDFVEAVDRSSQKEVLYEWEEEKKKKANKG
jgi:GLPGLI family protein